MAVEDLEKRRTGRPRGSKSAPPGLRAARWAVRHLADLDAVPPTELAARLLALGREHADRLAICLDELEARAQSRHGEASSPAREAPRDTPPPRQPVPQRRIKRLIVPAESWMSFLNSSSYPAWMNRLPSSFRLVGDMVVIRRGGEVFLSLIIQSSSFDEVAPGEPVPDVESL
jgi:hypothetical protein